MTATYENYNWFGNGHKETWTEPCAVVDSLILALELYRLTKDVDVVTATMGSDPDLGNQSDNYGDGNNLPSMRTFSFGITIKI